MFCHLLDFEVKSMGKQLFSPIPMGHGLVLMTVLPVPTVVSLHSDSSSSDSEFQQAMRMSQRPKRNCRTGWSSSKLFKVSVRDEVRFRLPRIKGQEDERHRRRDGRT